MSVPAVLTTIVNSNHFFYLYERWQDEKEYEDWNDYVASFEKTYGVKVLESTSETFTFKIEVDDTRYEVQVAVKNANELVSRYRPA